jgi:hypothetical protein
MDYLSAEVTIDGVVGLKTKYSCTWLSLLRGLNER